MLIPGTDVDVIETVREEPVLGKDGKQTGKYVKVTYFTIYEQVKIYGCTEEELDNLASYGWVRISNLGATGWVFRYFGVYLKA